MSIYFAGTTSSSLFADIEKDDRLHTISQFRQVKFPQLTDIEIGNTYLLLWQSETLFISYDPQRMSGRQIMLIELPSPSTDGYCRFVAPHQGKETISILTTNNVFWEYHINENDWKQISVFRPKSCEHAVKIIYCGCNMLLTNLGRLLIMHNEGNLEIESDVKFMDIAQGENLAILLAEDSNVYSLSITMCELYRHGDRNFVQNVFLGPDLITGLCGLRIVQIAASKSHIAVVTEQGHLYTWGSNTHGELGLGRIEYNIDLPNLVSFRRNNKNIEVKVKKVQCGNYLTICLADDDTLWGAGYSDSGQLGRHPRSMLKCSWFIRLDMRPLGGKTVKDLKCNESGTAIITE